MTPVSPPIGALLREWRQRRCLSQMELAAHADISQRHLSFLESGRSAPSREMVMRLARHLEVPGRERNALMLAAGFAPAYRERPLSDETLAPARAAIELLLRCYEPFPALAVNRHWSLVLANQGVQRLLSGVHPHLLDPPVNVLRLSLHPDGLGPRIGNLAEWGQHVIARLDREIRASGDPALVELQRELREYLPEQGTGSDARSELSLSEVVVPFQIKTDRGMLSFLSTTTVFGTPVDITLQEIAIEAFLPADAATASALQDAATAVT